MTTVKILKCTLPRENYVKDLGFHLRFKILISASFENHTLRHNLPCHTLKVKFLVFVSWDLTSQTFLKTYPFNHKRPQSPRCIVAEPLCPRRTPQGRTWCAAAGAGPWAAHSWARRTRGAKVLGHSTLGVPPSSVQALGSSQPSPR